MIAAFLATSVLLLGGAESALADKGQAAYFAGRFDDALAALDEAEAAAPEFSGERARIFALRAAVRFKRGESDLAVQMARRALLADPELSVRDYPPDVRQIFDTAREGLPARVLLQITGTPAGADVRVDGRLVTRGSISVVPGPHELAVLAEGFEPHTRRLDVAGDESIAVTLTAMATTAPGATTRRDRLLTGGAFGVAGAGAAGAAYSLHGLSVTRENRQKAGPGQRGFYDSHLQRFTLGAGAGIAIAAAASGYGTWRLFRTPARVTILPSAAGGGGVFVTARFGGPRSPSKPSLRLGDGDRAVEPDGGAELVGDPGARVERDPLLRAIAPE